MSHTKDFLLEIAVRAGRRPTAYGVDQQMRPKYGWSRTTAYNYVRGDTYPSESHALDIAAELELEPSYVLACIAADRARDQRVKSVWEKAAETIGRQAAAVIFAGGFAGELAHALALHQGATPLCILCKKAQRKALRFLEELAAGDGLEQLA